jgi:GNAT superfamily N-acetyltransferase
MEITITLLKNYPQYIPPLIQISLKELGPIWAPREAQLSQCLQSDSLPLTLVALDKNLVPVGMCSLAEKKGLRPDLSPWLGPLVVSKQYQRQGIGSQLVEAIKQKARQFGFEKLYLCTHDSELVTNYYQPRGWDIIGIDEWKGQSVTVMEIKL